MSGPAIELDSLPALEARGLTVRLSGSTILDGVDLSLASGEMVAVIGPNGAGKTTLLRTLAGVLRPETGSVTLGGRPIERLGRREIATTLAYLPQETSTGFALTVRDVVRLGRYAYLGAFRAHGRNDIRAVEAALERADVRGLAERTLPSLSGGERRRVFIARAMAQQARVLVLDEPTSALDVGHAVDVLRVLADLAAEGCSIVLSLHDLTLALRGPDRVLLLDRGRSAACGEPVRVLTGEAAREAFGVALVHVPEHRAILPRG